ncbi:MAG: SusE domain-containing protein [Bacteroidales bacterium]
MKIKSILLILAAGLLVLSSCEDIDRGAVMSSTVVRPDMTAPTGGTSFVITEATENNVMTKFTWNAADYGFQAATSYTLQITITDNFNSPNDIGVTTNKELEVLNSKMNTTLLILGAEPAVQTTVKCRIKAVISPNVPVIYSDTTTLTVTPFEKIIIYPKLYVPGDYQGWSASNENTVITSAKSDGKYEGYLYFNVATSGMKFLKVPAWEEANTIGDPDASGTSGNLQIGSWGGNNINVSGGPGVFKINADLNEAKYSWTKTEWGLIGDATGSWDVDKNLTYDPVTNLWTITTDLTGGKAIKFRANDAWTINLGDTGGDKKLEYGGDNIAVAASGNYTITLDLSKTIYKYKMVKNSK